jgi:oligopeptide/dipeptide ABC transporter ATP-binding protein
VNQEDPLLRVENLRIGLRANRTRTLSIVDCANLTLPARSAVGLVGESGSGKTMLCRSLIGTLGRRKAAVLSGHIWFGGHDLAQASEGTWRQVRGRQIGYVPQSSLAGLNPVLTVRTQLVEALTATRAMPGREAERRALELLDLVRIPRGQYVLGQRSHELSGGMRQRVMIAAALAQEPKLLVADEPTTALDVTVQRDILELIAGLRRDLGMALVLVSHDLAIVEQVCERVVVMYAGATVEAGPVGVVVAAPRHPYSRALGFSRVDTAVPGKDLETIAGEPPTVGAWPTGCRFWPRCPLADAACREGGQPPLMPIGGQLSACIHADRMATA